MGYLCEERWLFLCISYDYTAYMDYMDPDVLCPQKGRKSQIYLSLAHKG